MVINRSEPHILPITSIAMYELLSGNSDFVAVRRAGVNSAGVAPQTLCDPITEVCVCNKVAVMSVLNPQEVVFWVLKQFSHFPVLFYGDFIIGKSYCIYTLKCQIQEWFI